MTKADRARFDAFQTIGCVACRKRGIFNQADVHHLLSGGKRRGHQFTIPLCPAHHRGFNHNESMHGPSLAKSPRKFREAFGSDATLLALTNKLIGGTVNE